MAILRDRNIRWDNEITGLIQKATDCIVQSVIGSIRDVITRDVRRRIRCVMLSGQAFYFGELKTEAGSRLRQLLGHQVTIHNVIPDGAQQQEHRPSTERSAVPTRLPTSPGSPSTKRGLSKTPMCSTIICSSIAELGLNGNDILYNASVVRRNNQQLKAFKNKAIDIFLHPR